MKTRLKATAYGSFPSSFLDGVSAVFKKEDFSFLNSSQYSVFPGFCDAAGSHKTGRCAGVRECPAELQHRSRSACGRLSAEGEAAIGEAGEKAWRFSAPACPRLPAVRAVLGGKNGAFLRG